MTTESPRRRRAEIPLGGLQLLAAIVVFMWVIELINTVDSNRLDGDGIYARNVGRLWGVLTAPFLHVSFAHLISNTIPFVFMGVIIALEGARRLAYVTVIVIIVAGLGTWLISASSTSTGQPIVTVGASGVVFGYATYLFARGIFNRNVLELLVGGIVGVIWGGALLSSIVPHYGVSWQDHACGAVGGVVAAWVLSRDRKPAGGAKPTASGAGLSASV
jgi:membrane associated rhomboid family serine protease